MTNPAQRKPPPGHPCDVTLTTFRGISPAPKASGVCSWEDFCATHLPDIVATQAREKKRCAGFVLATVDGKRSDATVGPLTALAIDVDALPGASGPDALAALLERGRKLGLALAVYETPSSTDDAPRVRVIAALRKPVKPAHVPHARRALAEALGLEPDACGTARAIAASQVMFAGRLKGTRERGLWVLQGKPWRAPRVRTEDHDTPRRSNRASVEADHAARRLVAGPATPPGAAQSGGAFPFHVAPDLSAVQACVPPPGVDGDRHMLSRALGGWLARRGYSPQAIAEAVRAYVPSTDPDERARQAQDAAERVLAGLEAPGWDALAQWSDLHGKGRKTLTALERACRDPREPADWAGGSCGAEGVWSEWWAGVWPKVAKRWAYRERGKIAARRAENAEALAEAAPGLDGLETDDEGRPLGTADNLLRCVRHFLGHTLALDVQAGVVVLQEPVRLNAGPGETLEAGPWKDGYVIRMQAALNRLRIRHAYATDVRAAVQAVASERVIDVHGDWLRELAQAWDGAPRVDGALARYWRAADEPLTSAVSRVMFLSIAARGLKPGCQLDTVPVLISEQGSFKSQGLRALVWGKHHATPEVIGYGAKRRLCSSKLVIGSKDALASIRGYLIWEFAELASVRKADVDDLKQWLTQQTDTFRPPFGHEDVTYTRTIAPIASVNPQKAGHVVINRDTTGGRRWLPVHVAVGYVWADPSTYHLRADIRAIERDGPQLLGEAAARVLDGEQHFPTDAEVALLAPAVDAVTEDPLRSDPWYAPIARWARAEIKRQSVSPRGVRGFATAQIFADALEIVDASRHTRGDANRVADVLRDLGYVHGAPSNGVRRWRPA